MSTLTYLPETPSQTAGPYVHIGLIPNQAGSTARTTSGVLHLPGFELQLEPAGRR